MLLRVNGGLGLWGYGTVRYRVSVRVLGYTIHYNNELCTKFPDGNSCTISQFGKNQEKFYKLLAPLYSLGGSERNLKRFPTFYFSNGGGPLEKN